MVVEGLRTFRPDAEHNPGRMNFFTVGEVSVVIDLAHNEAGLEALFEIMNGVRRPGARLLLGLGAVGDRTDELIEKLGEIGARDSDVVAIGHKDALPARAHRRGARRADARRRRAGRRDQLRVVPHRGAGARRAGRAGAARATSSALMCHAERQEVYDWIAEHGGTPDDNATLAAKVRAAAATTRSRPAGPVPGRA